MSKIPNSLRRLVIQRAGDRCEYCQLSQTGQVATFHIFQQIQQLEADLTRLRERSLCFWCFDSGFNYCCCCCYFLFQLFNRWHDALQVGWKVGSDLVS